jgi:hypothetical protein
MTTTAQLRITRTPLPPAIIPDDETMWGRHDTYAEVSSGSLTAEVLRFAYWNDRAGCPDPELTYEVRIDGMPDNQGGTCELYATEAAHLLDLAAVCGAAAMLLDEARQGDRSQVQHA